MARSPLTLAASVTSALPDVGVVSAGALTEGAAGRFDSAIAELDDGRRVVVRAPVDDEAGSELAAQARALRALTPGIRKLLPFRAPEFLGEAGLNGSRALVVDFLPGYRVDPAELPPGQGAATSVGGALAALHGLPLSVVRTEGLPVRTPQQVRTDVRRLVERATATGRLPAALQQRWERAIDSDRLWHFESAIVLGGAGSASFLFEDVDGVPVVTGLLEWQGLSVGDPAVDLSWLASAPGAAADVLAAYTQHADRAPDALLRQRARLYAELEFASWLVHGHTTGREDVIADAGDLLDSLAATVAGSDIAPDAHLDVDEAIALLDDMPAATPVATDTSMHTDAYDPEALSLWIDRDDTAETITPPNEGAESTDARGATGTVTTDAAVTAPVDLDEISAAHSDATREAERAERAAFQRWASSASE